MAFNLPNLLTWQRILAIPLLVCVYMLPFDAWGEPSRNLWATVIFIVASLTDWLDGWLARRLGQQTELGAFLDPVADKLMVAVALILLVRLDRTWAICAIIIIGREITISALREWMAQLGKRNSVAVAAIGKFKTAAQMAAITLLLLQSWPSLGLDFIWLGNALMFAACVLTLWSMFYYLKMAAKEFKQPRPPEAG